MKPLTDIMQSNLNLYYFEQLKIARKKVGKEELPAFRHTALEVQFSIHLTEMCRLFSTFQTVKQLDKNAVPIPSLLTEHYDIP